MNRFLNFFKSLLKCHFLRRLPWVSFKNIVTLFHLHSPFPFYFCFVFFTILMTLWHLYMLFIIFIVHIFHWNISFLRAGIFAVLFTDTSLEPRTFPGTWQALSKCLLNLLEQRTCLRWHSDLSGIARIQDRSVWPQSCPLPSHHVASWWAACSLLLSTLKTRGLVGADTQLIWRNKGWAGIWISEYSTDSVVY